MRKEEVKELAERGVLPKELGFEELLKEVCTEYGIIKNYEDISNKYFNSNERLNDGRVVSRVSIYYAVKEYLEDVEELRILKELSSIIVKTKSEITKYLKNNGKYINEVNKYDVERFLTTISEVIFNEDFGRIKNLKYLKSEAIELYQDKIGDFIDERLEECIIYE